MMSRLDTRSSCARSDEAAADRLATWVPLDERMIGDRDT